MRRCALVCHTYDLFIEGIVLGYLYIPDALI